MVILESAICNLLLEWTKAVASFYRLQVSNFTSSFADGRVFCAIINFYFPSVITKDMIKWAETAEEVAQMLL